jgi:hypothetical protein
MTEKDLEQKFISECRKQGAWTAKFTSPAHAGVPDRVVIKNRRVIFIELKTDTGKITELQKHTHKEMARHGASVRVLRGKTEILEFFRKGLK